MNPLQPVRGMCNLVGEEFRRHHRVIAAARLAAAIGARNSCSLPYQP